MKRRDFLTTAVAGTLACSLPRNAQGAQARGAQAATPPAARGLFVCIHQASTARYDFKTSVEGIAKAGVRAVEVDIAKIREFAKTHYVQPARQHGKQELTIRAGDVHRDMKFTNRLPLVCSALQAKAFETLSRVRLSEQLGPHAGSNRTLKFEILP